MKKHKFLPPPPALKLKFFNFFGLFFLKASLIKEALIYLKKNNVFFLKLNQYWGTFFPPWNVEHKFSKSKNRGKMIKYWDPPFFSTKFCFTKMTLKYLNVKYSLIHFYKRLLGIISSWWGLNKRKALKLCLCVCFGIPSTSCVKCLYIEKELIPTVWKVFVILITSVFKMTQNSLKRISNITLKTMIFFVFVSVSDLGSFYQTQMRGGRSLQDWQQRRNY